MGYFPILNLKTVGISSFIASIYSILRLFHIFFMSLLQPPQLFLVELFLCPFNYFVNMVSQFFVRRGKCIWTRLFCLFLRKSRWYIICLISSVNHGEYLLRAFTFRIGTCLSRIAIKLFIHISHILLRSLLTFEYDGKPSNAADRSFLNLPAL